MKALSDIFVEEVSNIDSCKTLISIELYMISKLEEDSKKHPERRRKNSKLISSRIQTIQDLEDQVTASEDLIQYFKHFL